MKIISSNSAGDILRNYLSKITFFVYLALSCCQTENSINGNFDGYNFTTPDKSFVLPEILHEISGVTIADSFSIGCVQDEKGVLFIYDLSSNEIRKSVNFFSKGDYEGISKAGSSMFVLRSDGTIFEIADYESDEISVIQYKTGIPAKNNEGLCYDPDNNRLLIACKDKVERGFGSAEKRYVYGFDLKSKTLTKDPVYAFDIQRIKEFAVNNNMKLPLKLKKKGRKAVPDIKFRPSEIGIQPVTKDLYLLSAEEHLLFIFNNNGSIKNIVRLDPALFKQPEGIAFFRNRDMLISNEGQKKQPTLLRFNYR